MNVRVENFAEGLWFEIKFNAGSIDLIIKSLANYKEYWNRVKNTFDVAEYPGELHVVTATSSIVLIMFLI